MKNDNDFDDFVTFIAMINGDEPVSFAGCFSVIIGIIAVLLFIVLIIGSCN